MMRHRVRHRIMFSCILAGIWLGVFPTTLHAQSPATPALSIAPSFQEIVVTATQSAVPFQIRVDNPTTSVINVDVFPLDFQQLDAQGHIQFVDKASHTHALAKYITFDQQHYTIPANQTIHISGQVINMIDLSPGGHYGAVIIRQTEQHDTTQQQLLLGLSSILFIHKQGGEQFHLSLLESPLSNQNVVYTIPSSLPLVFANEGNVQIVPTGTIQWRDLFGRITHEGLVNVGSRYVLPQQRLELTAAIAPRRFTFPLMFYTVEITGNSTVHETPFSTRYTLWYISPWCGVVVVMVIIGSIGVFIRRKKIAHHDKKTSAHH